MFGIFYGLGKNSRPTLVVGKFEVSNAPGILTSHGSPPRQALIELTGGKVVVKLTSNEASAGGVNFKSSVGTKFTAEPGWFVSFDENRILHYGIHPKWVNRIEESLQSASIKTLQARERDEYLGKVRKELNW